MTYPLTLDDRQDEVERWAKSKGWHQDLAAPWDGTVDEPTALLCSIALQHAMYSDLLEHVRKHGRMPEGSELLAVSKRNTARRRRLAELRDTGAPFNVAGVVAKLALIASEVSEAVDAALALDLNSVKDGKPEGLGSENADILIRVLQLSACLGQRIEGDYRQKMNYNHSRPKKHGKLL